LLTAEKQKDRLAGGKIDVPSNYNNNAISQPIIETLDYNPPAEAENHD